MDCVKDLFRHQYHEAVGLVVNCIRARFDQPGHQIYEDRISLLLNATNGDNSDEEFQKVADFYKDDFNSCLLRIQLESLNASFKENKDISRVDKKAILKYFRSTLPVYRTFYSEVIKLLKLILVMPATNAIRERSFSALKRVKTFLRTTMTQRRLNHPILLHVHKDKTDNIDLKEISNDFVCNENRLSLFGQF